MAEEGKDKIKIIFSSEIMQEEKKDKRGEREKDKAGNRRPTGAVSIQNCVFFLEKLLLVLFVRRPIC